MTKQTIFRIVIILLACNFIHADGLVTSFNNLTVHPGLPGINQHKINDNFIRTATLELFDQSRNRSVPIEIYVSNTSEDRAKSGIAKLPVVIINHGYNIKNTEYTFIANALANLGYFVVSIQHDLASDPVLPKTGNLFQERKPFWERGVLNILFAISELKKIKPYLDLSEVILIGHSNGGDISMMFTEIHPNLVEKAISLDSLRYPFPTKDGVKILSLRANDTKVDDGVLPKSDATIITLQDVKHIDLCDRGPNEAKHKIIDLISRFIEGQL